MKMPDKRKAGWAGVLMVVLVFIPGGFAARAAHMYWTNTGGGDFTNTANWQGGNVPGAGDTAHFNIGSTTYTVTFSCNVTNSAAAFDDGTVTFSAAPWTWTAGWFYVQTYSTVSWDSGILNLDGNVTSSGSEVRFTQNGGTVTTTSLTWIGAHSYAQNNMLIITGSSSVYSNTGAWLSVGYDGRNATLVVTNGGRLFTVSANTMIGNSTSPNNQAFVTGAGSVWDLGVQDTYVGYGIGSNNTLTIMNGGVLTNGLSLYIGKAGQNNSLTVSNGGLVYAASTVIGQTVDASNNTVLVTGSGSVLTNSGAMSIGYSGGTQGGGNQLVLGSGGRVFTTNLYLQDNALTNTLKFVAIPGSTNVGVVNVSGALTIANASTARLVVDMSQYTEWRAGVTSVVLVTYGSLPTPFSAGNIAVTPPPMLPMRITPTVDQTGNRIQVNLRVPKGTVVSGR